MTDQTTDQHDTPPAEPITDPDHEDAPGAEAPDDDAPEMFPREYVEELRRENGKYRQRAQQVDEYATRLHTALVAATGRLADPSDLPFDETHIGDPDALNAAVEALLTAKPHLASRKPVGDIGQGARPSADTFSLAGVLRSNAS